MEFEALHMPTCSVTRPHAKLYNKQLNYTKTQKYWGGGGGGFNMLANIFEIATKAKNNLKLTDKTLSKT